jgi:hypothetical protein
VCIVISDGPWVVACYYLQLASTVVSPPICSLCTVIYRLQSGGIFVRRFCAAYHTLVLQHEYMFLLSSAFGLLLSWL